MTKRFILKKCKLYDIQYNKDIAIATFRNVDDAEVIESWLNELYDENEQLKFQLEECKNNKLYSRRELEKENEQLRKDLSDCEKFRYQIFQKIGELGDEK